MRVLEGADQATHITCVTRWRVDEIISGVCDPQIYRHLTDMGNSSLLLVQDLHAKYYRADDCLLVGSANLTNAGLGWAVNSNIELLVPITRNTPELAAFEGSLLNRAIEVNEELFATASQLVQDPGQHVPPVEDSLDLPSLSDWFPTARDPSHLFTYYRMLLTPEADREVPAAVLRDLQTIKLPPQLDEQSFDEAVRFFLLSTPIVRDYDRFLAVSRRFGETLEFIKRRIREPELAERSAQTLIRWLRYFAPDRYAYRRPSHSEVMERRKAQ